MKKARKTTRPFRYNLKQILYNYLVEVINRFKGLDMVDKVSGGFPGGASGKELTCQCRRHKRHGFDLWVRKISWRRPWQPTPVFLPGESHGQRSLVGYSPYHRVAKSRTQLKQLSTHIPHWM